MNLTPDIKTSLRLRRTFSASPEKVFQAWTNVEAIKLWFGPGGFKTLSADIDLRIDGQFRFEMQSPEGTIYYAGGRYQEIQKPSKLVFTWAWEGNETASESIVTLEFLKRGNQTELTLSHERLPSETARDSHLDGWMGSLNRLHEFMESQN